MSVNACVRGQVALEPDIAVAAVGEGIDERVRSSHALRCRAGSSGRHPDAVTLGSSYGRSG